MTTALLNGEFDRGREVEKGSLGHPSNGWIPEVLVKRYTCLKSMLTSGLVNL